MEKLETGICSNCGSDIGLHQFETEFCPINIWVESNKWRTTKFEDLGIKKLHDAAPDLLEALKLLVDNLERFNYTENSLMFTKDELRKAKQAIKKAT